MFGLDPTLTFALIIGVLSAVTFMVLIAAFAGGGSRRYTRRLNAVANRKPGAAQRAGTSPTRSLSRQDSTTPGLDAVFRLLPKREALVERLSRTGYQISVGQYMMGTFATMLVVMVLIMIFVGLGFVPSLLFGIGIGTIIPHYLIGRAGKKRIARFIGLLPEALDLMVRALRAGLPISEAIINAGQEIGDPVGTEFHGIEAGMRLGRDLDSLLWDIAKRIPAPELRFFIIALSVQRETGGNLAETLNNLSDVLRRRRAMRAKARAMASEARASTAILGSLPVAVTLILLFTSPTYITPMFSDVRGLVMIAVALGMLLSGIGVMVKMARFEI